MDLFDHADASLGEFKIVRGLPLEADRAPKRHRQWKRPEFPFSRMEKGDSFDCTPDQVGGAPLIVTQNIVSGAAATYAKNCDGERPKFATRQIRGECVRCWRVS